MTVLPSVAGHRLRDLARRPTVVGGGLILAGLVAFAALFDGVQESADLSVWDSPVLGWLLAHRSGVATAVLTRVSWLADPPVLSSIVGVVLIAVVWRTRRLRPALLLGGAMGLALTTSSAVKVLVARARPPVSDMIAPPELTFAFPSGHTLGSAVFLLVVGYLCWTARPTRRVALTCLAVATAGTLAVATSRLYLGYHWLTDITASITLAVTILGVVIVADHAVLRTPDRVGADANPGS